MKSFLIKLISMIVVAACIISALTGLTVFAEPSESANTDTIQSNEADDSITEAELSQTPGAAFDSAIDSGATYAAYIAKYATAARPNVEMVLSAKDAKAFDEQTGAAKSALPLVDVASKNTPDDVRTGAYFSDVSLAGWTFNIPETGLYNFEISYFAFDTLTYTENDKQVTVNSKSAAVSRKLYVDNKIPFYEARQINLERVWKDVSLISVDNSTGNEKRPYQEEAPQWQTINVRDSLGYLEEPFSFYFTAGEHTIAFEAIREGMVVEKIRVYQAESVPTYNELKQEYASKNYKTASGQILYIQAEGYHSQEAYGEDMYTTMVGRDEQNAYSNYISSGDVGYDATKDPTYSVLKSSPTLYSIIDRSSPVSAPYHYSKIRYNTIGGEKWQSPNQWIQWNVNVEEEGLYALTFKARQNILSGMYTTRRLTINGVQPCVEAGNIRFNYSTGFNNVTVGDENGAYYFYFKKGENQIKMETTLGDLGALLNEASSILVRLNAAYRRILVITGPSPDTNNDYQLQLYVPDALQILKEEYQALSRLEEKFISIYGAGASAQLSSIKSMLLTLDKMNSDNTRVASMFSDFKSAIAAIGTWLNDMSQVPLELDYIVLSSEDKLSSIVSADAGFGAKLIHEIRAFIASFTEDYDNIGGTVVDNNQKPVDVWLETGAGLTGNRDNATVLKQITDDMFTEETGISVSIRLVAAGSLLPSTLAGIGPDVCLSRSSVDVINYAFRGAVQNLHDKELFPDCEDVLLDQESFSTSAIEPFTFGNGIYATPETQDFFMIFYRTDVLEELGLEPPQTWDDVYAIIGELQNKQMTFAMPVPVLGGVGAGNMAYAMLLYQNGGRYYNDDRSSCDLATDAAIDAFNTWTKFYTLWDIPNTYDFANRFRTGEVPIGIASYSAYSTLAVFAPEIQGLWEFSLVPGTERVDENGNSYIDRSCASNSSGCVMLSMDTSTEDGKNTARRAWEFMKWWTGEEAQYRFGTEIESLLGAAARYQTANRKAMQRLPWESKSMQTIMEQWKHSKAIPQAPGGYYTERNIEFAWKEVINNNSNANTVFVEYVSKINQEIARKCDEFKDKIAVMLK